MKNERITSRDIDFAKWYTDIVREAKLANYSSIKGCLVIEPYGYAIWENMQNILNNKFKELGHENVYLPLFITESLLEKEKEHVEGFAPEVAWITHGGKNELQEKLCVRPTSETLFSEYYASIVNSYRDLPKLYNQWCNVVRWEKETRPFLRSREFLWQEGHTIHETKEEAIKETLQMLDVYEDFFVNYLAIPVIKGKKTEKEKFAGADATYTIEAMMYNGIILQSATSHYFGQNFSRVFDIKFRDRNNNYSYVEQTSWGSTTRMIGALIMVHSDDNGLVLPPKIAPKQVVIIPIRKDELVDEYTDMIYKRLKDNGIRVFIDDSDNSIGYKFNENEKNGIPVRIEVGPRDLANGKIVLVRRDTGDKIQVSVNDDIFEVVNNMLDDIQNNMLVTARKRRDERTYNCKSKDEIKEIIKTKPGFIKAMWCGDKACEVKLKEINGLKSRCIPFKEEKIDDKCVCCGREAKHMVYWGIQY